jgi:hypothetical protein
MCKSHYDIEIWEQSFGQWFFTVSVWDSSKSPFELECIKDHGPFETFEVCLQSSCQELTELFVETELSQGGELL